MAASAASGAASMPLDDRLDAALKEADRVYVAGDDKGYPFDSSLLRCVKSLPEGFLETQSKEQLVKLFLAALKLYEEINDVLLDNYTIMKPRKDWILADIISSAIFTDVFLKTRVINSSTSSATHKKLLRKIAILQFAKKECAAERAMCKCIQMQKLCSECFVHEGCFL